MTNDLQDIEALKAMARHSVESATDGRKRILEEHSAAFRWLMASFLAVNGAGLIYLKDAEFVTPGWVLYPAIAFYVGVVSAFAIAWLGQRAAGRSAEVMSELGVFWAMVAHTGEFHEEEFKRLSVRAQRAVARTKFAPLAGWLSLLSFSAGLILIAAGWKQ
jgi:hypothetical protein